MPGPTELVEREPVHRRRVGLVLAAAVGAVLVAAVVSEPRGANTLPAIARYAMTVALPGWHTTEPVNEVVYGTRGFDTFGETFLLLAAVVGIGTITRGKEPRRGFIGEELLARREQGEMKASAGGRDDQEEAANRAGRAEQGDDTGRHTTESETIGTRGPERSDAMTVIVTGGVRIASPLLLIAGIYLVAWGYSPGGGFPAGGVALGVILLVYVGYGYRGVRRVIRPGLIEPLEMAGALLIAAIELAGLILKGSFSANFLPLAKLQSLQSGGILQAFSGSELLEVGTGLTLAVFGLLGMGDDWSRDPKDDEPEASL